MGYDFCGYVTKNDLRCSDGRVIRRDAFKHNDGQKVPLVYNHVHDNPMNILGNVILEHRDDGVYGYGSFNETESALHMKESVKHGDISSMSIFANHLRQERGSDCINVVHGEIREVSLVLAGANPGAYIENLQIEHSDGSLTESESEAIIFSGSNLDVIEHVDSDYLKNETSKDDTEEVAQHADDRTVEDVWNDFTDDEKNVVYYIIADASGANEEETEVEHADTNEGGKTIKEVFDNMSEEKKQVAYYIIGTVLGDDDTDTAEHSDIFEGETVMKHNVFDAETETEDNVLSHSEIEAIFNDAKRYGSMRESALQHGVTEIEYLFPDAKTLNNTPDFIRRDNEWVADVMNGTHHTPFSRIKSIHADITEDDARALGYLPDHTHRDEKGNLVDAEGKPAYKKEEVFGLLKRTTTPTTIYKKQKLDRDDVIDITDFDVVAWIKGEMRMMLDEEIARAILIGDGRLASSDDKINEQNIRPVWTDADLYTVKYELNASDVSDPDKRAKAFIRQAIKARKNYKGSGNPTLYTTEDMLTDMLLLEDGIGRPLYDSVSALATKLRVNKIVPVPVMEGATRQNNSKTMELLGLFVNLKDYNVGADKGGAVSMFDDFDIDYNAQKYLIETRCSGAMVKPYGAFAIEFDTANATSEING